MSRSHIDSINLPIIKIDIASQPCEYLPQDGGHLIRVRTMKKIALSQGKYALVDDADFIWLSKWKWYAVKNKGTFYAQRTIRRSGVLQKIKMHREILNLLPIFMTDHRDGNGLNNQRNNLRICNPRENGMNKSVWAKSVTRTKGVYFVERSGKFKAYIRANRKVHHLGTYNDMISAARAYDNAAIIFFGDFARLNNLDRHASQEAAI